MLFSVRYGEWCSNTINMIFDDVSKLFRGCDKWNKVLMSLDKTYYNTVCVGIKPSWVLLKTLSKYGMSLLCFYTKVFHVNFKTLLFSTIILICLGLLYYLFRYFWRSIVFAPFSESCDGIILIFVIDILLFKQVIYF